MRWTSDIIWDQIKAEALAYALKDDGPLTLDDARGRVAGAIKGVTGDDMLPKDAVEYYSKELCELVERYRAEERTT